jgi:hypothetical protein
MIDDVHVNGSTLPLRSIEPPSAAGTRPASPRYKDTTDIVPSRKSNAGRGIQQGCGFEPWLESDSKRRRLLPSAFLRPSDDESTEKCIGDISNGSSDLDPKESQHDWDKKQKELNDELDKLICTYFVPKLTDLEATKTLGSQKDLPDPSKISEVQPSKRPGNPVSMKGEWQIDLPAGSILIDEKCVANDERGEKNQKRHLEAANRIDDKCKSELTKYKISTKQKQANEPLAYISSALDFCMHKVITKSNISANLLDEKFRSDIALYLSLLLQKEFKRFLLSGCVKKNLDGTHDSAECTIIKQVTRNYVSKAISRKSNPTKNKSIFIIPKQNVFTFKWLSNYATLLSKKDLLFVAYILPWRSQNTIRLSKFAATSYRTDLAKIMIHCGKNPQLLDGNEVSEWLSKAARKTESEWHIACEKIGDICDGIPQPNGVDPTTSSKIKQVIHRIKNSEAAHRLLKSFPVNIIDEKA